MKQELLKIIDQELLEKLFGFCYARTRDSQEAQELCSEAAEELHVPTVYVEEELEILSQGEDGRYGLLRRTDNGRGTIGMDATGRYAINFILFDREEIRALWDVYQEQIPAFCPIASDYVAAHREEYMAFPYLNRKVDWNLVLWQQMHRLARMWGLVAQSSLTAFCLC